MSDQIGLVFLLIYACGALIELLIRISLGVPAWAKPAFEQHICLVALQPVVFMLLPAILWPLVALHHIFRPICDRVMRWCCWKRKDQSTAESSEEELTTTSTTTTTTTTTTAGTTPDAVNTTTARSSIASSMHDLEKQEIRVETTPVPSTSGPRTTRL